MFDCLYGADVEFAAEKMIDNLVLNAIIFCCEGERVVPGLIRFGIGSGVEGVPPIANC